jgi:hypothetical protein
MDILAQGARVKWRGVVFPIFEHGPMRHDWIFEVLEDLQSYALKNGLPATAAQAKEALRIARAEIAAAPGEPPAGGAGPGNGRPH